VFCHEYNSLRDRLARSTFFAVTGCLTKSQNLNGNLYKQGKGESVFGKKNWKKRWFQLEDDKLQYFENMYTARNKHPPLNTLVLTFKSNVGFLESETKKEFVFQVETDRRQRNFSPTLTFFLIER
jgi:hypothetical protein